MKEKTKKLLDNLNKITKKTKLQFEREIIDIMTNRFYVPNSQHTLPKSYDNAKKYNDKDWIDGEYIIIDRVYGGIYGQSLTQKDGTEYKGKLYHKRRLMQGADGKNFYSSCTATVDGRWFDNVGMPIEQPKQVEIEKEEDKKEETPTVEMWSSEPKEKEDKELGMLKKLK